MQIHKRRFHSENEACPECNEYFKKSNMARHMRKVHTKDSEKKYQCDKCKKGFIEKNKFSEHMISYHTDEKPYSCRYTCGHATNDRSNRNMVSHLCDN